MNKILRDMLYKLTSPYIRTDLERVDREQSVQTNIGKLFSLFAGGLELIGENAQRVRDWDNIENAQGATLDRYGANCGVKRFSQSDELYRLAIKVKVLSQLSGGDADTMIRAASDLLGLDEADLTYKEYFPAKIGIHFDWNQLSDERKELIDPIAESLKRLAVAGVGFKVYPTTTSTMPTSQIGIRSTLWYSVMETRLPNVELAQGAMYDRIGIRAGHGTLSTTGPLTDIPPKEYDFRGKVRLGDGFRTEYQTTLLDARPEYDFGSRISVGAAMRGEATTDLPEGRPDFHYCFKFSLAGGFQSVSQDGFPTMEPEYHFEGSEPFAPTPEEPLEFGGKLRLASDFTSQGETAVPTARPDYSFDGTAGIRSGQQTISDTSLPDAQT